MAKLGTGIAFSGQPKFSCGLHRSAEEHRRNQFACEKSLDLFFLVGLHTSRVLHIISF